MSYRASQDIFAANYTPQERMRLAAAVALHHMEQIAEPDFEQVWFDNISAETERMWDSFATVCESARFGR